MDFVRLLQGDGWLKHPAHPALVAIPIGCWTFSAVMDGIAFFSKNKCHQEAADNAVIAGLVGAGLAAPTGISEFLRVPTGGTAIKDAVIHGSLNVSAATLYGINASMRTRARREGRALGLAPKIMSLIGVMAVSYTAWLGGLLAYNHGVGVSLRQADREHRTEQLREQEKEEEQIRASI